MAKKLYEEEKIRAIAERIRLHTGEDNLMTTAQMPEGVNSVYMVGNADGYDTGYGAAVKASLGNNCKTFTVNGKEYYFSGSPYWYEWVATYQNPNSTFRINAGPNLV